MNYQGVPIIDREVRNVGKRHLEAWSGRGQNRGVEYDPNKIELISSNNLGPKGEIWVPEAYGDVGRVAIGMKVGPYFLENRNVSPEQFIIALRELKGVRNGLQRRGYDLPEAVLEPLGAFYGYDWKQPIGSPDALEKLVKDLAQSWR
jgi:hypothetical protein